MQRGQKPLLPEKREVLMTQANINLQKEKADEKKMRQGEAKEDLVSFLTPSKLMRNSYFPFLIKLQLCLR